MKDRITERIKTLKTELEDFIQRANTEAAARNAVIKELEKLIEEPKPAPRPAAKPATAPAN